MKHLHLDNSDVLALIQSYFVLAAIAFFIPAMLGEFPMKPEVYGSAVYVVPAEAWAGYLLICHGTAAVGIWMNRPIMAAIGALAAVLAYVAFPVLAIRAAFSDLVVIFSALVNAPMCLTIGLKYLTDGVNGRSNRK